VCRENHPTSGRGRLLPLCPPAGGRILKLSGFVLTVNLSVCIVIKQLIDSKSYGQFGGFGRDL
jgi:hypothetical protein